MKMIIAISMGDYNGVGPEVILKCLNKQPLSEVTPLILGNLSVFQSYSKLCGISLPFHAVESFSEIQEGKVNLLNCSPDNEIKLEPGIQSKSSGLASMKAIEKGIELCLKKKADALITAPISKEAVQKAGYNIPGHTEFLAEKTHTANYMMILAAGDLRVGLVTGHIPVSRVSSEVTQSKIVEKITTMNQSLIRDFGIESPKIAVFGLNPHAGDGGVLGTEEIDVIIPAIKSVVKDGINAEGPFAADGFFGSQQQQFFDGIVAMYHDQGLVPFKTLSFGNGVNFTAGLPIIRTSPDHGTAFGIAGKNTANEQSFTSAFELAKTMVLNRNKSTR